MTLRSRIQKLEQMLPKKTDPDEEGRRKSIVEEICWRLEEKAAAKAGQVGHGADGRLGAVCDLKTKYRR